MSSNNIDNYSHSIDWIFEKVVWWHSCLQLFLPPKHRDVHIRLYELPIFKLRECNFRLECRMNSYSYKRQHNHCFVTFQVIVRSRLTLLGVLLLWKLFYVKCWREKNGSKSNYLKCFCMHWPIYKSLALTLM